MSKSQQLRRIEDLFFNLNYDSKYYGECWHHAIDAYHDQLGTEGVLGQIVDDQKIIWDEEVIRSDTIRGDGEVLAIIHSSDYSWRVRLSFVDR